MLSPAFEMQYSARFTEAAYAETEVMKTIRPHPRSSIQPAASAVRNCGPFKVGDDQLVEALLGGLQHVATLARRHAGVVHQQVETLEALARVADQRGAVRGGRHIG